MNTANFVGRYKLRVYDPDTTDLLAEIEDWRYLEVSHTVNLPGHSTIRIDGSGDIEDLFPLNAAIEVLRKVPGYNPDAVPVERQRDNGWYVEWSGLHTDTEHTTYQNGDEVFVSYGDGPLDLVRRREILYKASASSSESKKVAIPAQTAIYEFVEENLGVSATTGNNRLIDGVMTGVNIPLDVGGGPNWSGLRAYRNVLETIQEIGNFGSIDFDVYRESDGTFTFRTYEDQLGEDRTATGIGADGKNASGNAPMIFSLALDNVERVTYKTNRKASANVVVTLGKGQFSARAYGLRTDSTTIDVARINQREFCRNASSQDSQDELDDMADEWIERLKATDDFKFIPLLTENSIYGVHYWWGDLVTARYRNIERNKRVLGVTIVVDENGEQFRQWKIETIPRV